MCYKTHSKRCCITLHEHRLTLYEHSKKIEKSVNDLTKEIANFHRTFAKILPIVGTTGVNVSLQTIKNLQHILSQDGKYEKLDPYSCDWTVFKEVLGISDDLAVQLKVHFGQKRRDLDTIMEIDGITEMFVEQIQLFFNIESP